MEFVGSARNRESSCGSMEASKHTPNDAHETPGGSTKTPGLSWRIAARSILTVLGVRLDNFTFDNHLSRKMEELKSAL